MHPHSDEGDGHRFSQNIDGIAADINVSGSAIWMWFKLSAWDRSNWLQIEARGATEAAAELRKRGARPGEKWHVVVAPMVVDARKLT